MQNRNLPAGYKTVALTIGALKIIGFSFIPHPKILKNKIQSAAFQHRRGAALVCVVSEFCGKNQLLRKNAVFLA